MKSKFRILIVDDDEDDYVLLRDMLTGNQPREAEIEWAGTFDLGLEAIRRGTFDIHLIDYRLGDRDGLEFIQQANAGGCDTPSILLTGYDSPDVDDRALTEGAADFLVKDQITPPLLERSIRYAIERHKVEEALRESEERWRGFADASFDGLLIHDSGVILDANERFAEMFGCAADELRGTMVLELVAPESLEAVREKLLWQVAEPYEATGRRKDGSTFLMEVSSREIAYKGREQRAMAVRDITERKRAEEELRESTAMLAVSQQIGNLGSWEWNAATDEGKWSEETYRIFGLAPDSPPPSFARLLEMVHPEDRDAVMKSIEEAIANRRSYEFEYRVIRPDGTCRVCNSKAELILDDAGGVTGMVGIIQDITERKRTEEAQRESEYRYERLSELTGDGIVIHDGNTIVDVNTSFCRMFGYDFDELVGHGFSHLLAPASIESVKDHLATASEEPYEVLLVRKDGTVFPGELAGRNVTYHGDEFRVASVRNLTERKRAEMAIQESEERFRAAAETANDAIISANDKGAIIYWNKAAELIFGYGENEVVGKPITKLIPKSLRSEHKKGFQQASEKGELRLPGAVMEVAALSKDGSEIPIELSVSKWEAGGQRFFMAIIRDITERKQAESKLRESEDRLNEAARIANLGYWIWDEVNDKIIDCSDGYARIYGTTKENILASSIGETDFVFVHRGDRDLVKKSFQAFADNPETYDIEYRNAQPDGTKRYIREVGKPIFDEEGQLVQSFGIIQDITERKQMERQLARSQKMEAVGQLTGGIAHDFNNLLQVVLGNLWLAQGKLEGDDGPLDIVGILELQGEAIKAVNRGAKLTHQLLAFSRKQTLSPETVDPNELIEGMARLLRRTLGEDIGIETFLEDAIPPIHVDTGNLENAILNLTLNAKGAMPKGGKLTIGTFKRNLDQGLATEDGGLPVGGYVEITVTDTGSGMSPQTLDRAIEPFFTTKDVGEGSGLGLSMVYGFVKQSGGHLTLQSEVGKGTTVNILLPVAEAKADAKADARGEKPKDTATETIRGTILVVEDDPILRRTTVRLLEKAGYTTLEAEDAFSAIEVLKNEDGIDLLFSDVVMPKGITGIELAREASQTMGTKVLLTSGYPIAELEKFGLSESGFKLLEKPYSADQLSAAVKALIEG